MSARFAFDNTYARLPERFHVRTAPTPVSAPRLIRVNRHLAEELGLDPDFLCSPEGVEILAGNRLPEGADPIAAAYAGHQFGGFVPQLGDGRAILLGEVLDRRGRRRDIQLKGAGRTAFSRGGDGRAALGPVLREYLLSEAMAALGIPTTRALAAVLTGDRVAREELLPGAVLTRVASSHIRVGTFEFFARRGDTDGVRLLADHVIERHYPAAAGAANPHRALLDAVVRAQAELIADWLLVGFIHGVMNTDNMAVSGETIDYGPCAFMDHYDPETVFSAIDRQGRYAYGNQPGIGQWNLARLAECLLPLLGEGEEAALAAARESLAAYVGWFESRYQDGLATKIGLSSSGGESSELAAGFLKILGEGSVDFTLSFRRLADAASGPEAEAGLRALFRETDALDAWLPRWYEQIDAEPGGRAAVRAAMRAVNPAFIPRNHQVEAVIRAGVDRDDFAPFEQLLAVLENPFDDQAENARYAEPPQPHERVRQTFCGT
jgi:serine/tyrosine/threonine adenylyltransferase